MIEKSMKLKFLKYLLQFPIFQLKCLQLTGQNLKLKRLCSNISQHSTLGCWEYLLYSPPYLLWQKQQLPIIDILNYFIQQIWEPSTVEILWPRTRNNGPTSIGWPGLRSIVESGIWKLKQNEIIIRSDQVTFLYF